LHGSGLQTKGCAPFVAFGIFNATLVSSSKRVGPPAWRGCRGSEFRLSSAPAVRNRRPGFRALPRLPGFGRWCLPNCIPAGRGGFCRQCRRNWPAAGTILAVVKVFCMGVWFCDEHGADFHQG
jgi:hypothetical protein